MTTPETALPCDVMQTCCPLVETAPHRGEQFDRKVGWHFSQRRGEGRFRPLENVLENPYNLFP